MDTIVTVTGTMIVKGLAAGYGEEELFAGLDLVVAPGDVIGLVGANGAGKSTLLRTLAGLHERQPVPVHLLLPQAALHPARQHLLDEESPGPSTRNRLFS